MADVSITAASVDNSANGVLETVTAGATVTRGQPVYKDSADSNEYKPAQATSTKYAALGIAMTDAGDGQPLVICRKDASFTIGGTVAVGVVYAVSATAGGIAPIGDLTTGDYTTVLGVGLTTSTIKLDCDCALQAAAAIA